MKYLTKKGISAAYAGKHESLDVITHWSVIVTTFTTPKHVKQNKTVICHFTRQSDGFFLTKWMILAIEPLFCQIYQDQLLPNQPDCTVGQASVFTY